MSETIIGPEQGEGRYYTQTVVEVVDSGRKRRVLALILLVLIALLGVLGYLGYKALTPPGSPSRAALPEGVTWVRSIYAWGNTPGTLLNGPVDAAISPDGTIWTISGKTTLVAFNANGTPKTAIALKRGGAEGMVNSLEGMDIGDNGEIYTADFGNNKIVVFDESGRILREIGVPLPVELDVRGDRMAVATANGVAIISTDGKPIGRWGTRGPAKDQFDLPHGIAWGEDGNIYVSDTDNKRIKAYTDDGKLLWVYPKSREYATRAGLASAKATSTASGIQLPAGMTVDAAGRVVFVDPFEFKAIAIDASGKGLGESWGDFGHADGMFAYPTGIAYDTDRDYYVVADTANNRLQVMRFAGSGGNRLQAVALAALQGPWWLGGIPLGFLLGALILWLLNRRRQEETIVDEFEAKPALG